jgi:hypothetical protein
MVALVFLVCIKAYMGRLTKWWVPLTADGESISESLNGRLHRMEFLAEKSEDRQQRMESGRREMEQVQPQPPPHAAKGVWTVVRSIGNSHVHT